MLVDCLPRAITVGTGAADLSGKDHALCERAVPCLAVVALGGGKVTFALG